MRWFDELYIWIEGAAVSTTQRANIQLNSLRDAFEWLAYDLVEQVGVTISFGTVERTLDPLTALFERLRSRYRLRAFADMLRGLNYPVGYRLSAPRVSMEIAGVDLVQPSFAKVLATTVPRAEVWEDMALEVRALGLDTRTTIVGGIEVPQQAHLARGAGFELGQGRAIRQPYPPPSAPTTSAAS